MSHYQYLNPAYKQLLHEAKLSSFDALWQHKLDWFEEPNKRRNGWSGVCRLTLEGQAFFLKRQENHNTRTVRHPFRGEPTFRREFNNIQRFACHKVPALEAIFYGERKQPGKHQAILITRSLEPMQSVDSWYRANNKEGKKQTALTETTEGQQVFNTIADLFLTLHSSGLAHWCPYPNHIFIDAEGEDARFIDLEKARWQPVSLTRRFKDLYCFIRHAPYMHRDDLIYLVNAYIKRANNLTCSPRLRHDLMRKIKAR